MYRSYFGIFVDSYSTDIRHKHTAFFFSYFIHLVSYTSIQAGYFSRIAVELHVNDAAKPCMGMDFID